MDTIKELLVNGGYVTAKLHDELEKDFPNLKVCIKWGQSERQPMELWDLRNKMKEGEARGDYVREVFVPVHFLDKMQEAFGITEDDEIEYHKSIA